jgi:hypothetical protein
MKVFGEGRCGFDGRRIGTAEIPAGIDPPPSDGLSPTKRAGS